MRRRIFAVVIAVIALTAVPSFAQAETRKLKVDFDNMEDFYIAAEAGFSNYFRRYSPKVVSKDDEELIMVAKYGKHNVMCTFYQSKSQYFVTLETAFDRDRIKWLNNVVKNVEKQ